MYCKDNEPIQSDEITKLDIPKPLPPISTQPPISKKIAENIEQKIQITKSPESTPPNFPIHEADTSPQIPKKIQAATKPINL